MSSAPAPPKKLVFAPVAPAEAEPAPQNEGALVVHRKSPLMPMLFGVLTIVAALAFLLVEREPELEVIDLAAAANCPSGSAATSGRMLVTASTLNVRAGPSPRADRLADRTLRKKATVTEECRAGTWSRVRLVDGRSGWVANEYLAPTAVKN